MEILDHTEKKKQCKTCRSNKLLEVYLIAHVRKY